MVGGHENTQPPCLISFKRKGGKPEAAPATADDTRKLPNPRPYKINISYARARNETTQITKNSTQYVKIVVNLLLPETDYNNQKTGVGAILQIMAGKRKKGKRRNARTESCTRKPLERDKCIAKEQLWSKSEWRCLYPHKLKIHQTNADFVKALVLQKYSKRNDNKEHVSLVYVNEQNWMKKTCRGHYYEMIERHYRLHRWKNKWKQTNGWYRQQNW